MRFWRAVWTFEWGLAAIGAGSMLFIMMMVTVTARIVACVLDSQSVTPLTETN